jgi:hypothetical protein
MGKTATALTFLERGAVVRMPASYAPDPLAHAVVYRDTVLFDALLEAGIDMRTSANGETALTLASTRRHFDYVPPLIRAGADVNAVTTDGWTALTLQLWPVGRSRAPPDVPTIIHLLASGAVMDMGPGHARIDDPRARQGTTIMLRVVPEEDRRS